MASVASEITTYYNNVVYGNAEGAEGLQSTTHNTISADPLFVNYKADGSGDYHLKLGSKGIDGGTTTGAPATDYAGNPRPQGKYDIGPYENGSSGGSSHEIVGTSGPDKLVGTAGDDLIVGRLGADTLVGQSGADTLQGSNGNDVIYGLWGFDVLSGGQGADRFIWGPLSNGVTETDMIKDYSRADGDRVHLAEGSGSIASWDVVHGDLELTLTNLDHDKVILHGINSLGDVLIT